MRVLFVASEVAPLAKSGGLADVAGALPAALVATGDARVDVLTPAHGNVVATGVLKRHVVELPAGRFDVGVETRVEEPGRSTLLVHCPALYGRRGLYGEAGIDYPDNPIRFAVLSRLAADLASEYDVVHANDWHAALALEYLRNDAGRTRVASVLTLHNVAFQAVLHPAWLELLGVDSDRFTPAGVEYYGQLNLLKAGITSADVVTTVSSVHASELSSPSGGFGLDGLMRALPRPVVGITNGIAEAWNPETDAHLPARFGAGSLGGKRVCREALCRRFGIMPPAAGIPVVASVGRMTSQKGTDLLVEAVRPLLAHGRIAFVALGTGDANLEHAMRDLAATFPGRAGVEIGYNEPLAHLIEAGADAFAMPSRFEPCGTNQLYSMRYGTVPIVHATGGLAETVVDAASDSGTGFVFSPCTLDALTGALERAITSFSAESPWQTLVANGMNRDSSWRAPATRYIALYRRTLEERHDSLERR